MASFDDDRAEILSNEKDSHGLKKGSLASRLKLLNESRQSWQERVRTDDKDEAANLTTAVKTVRLKERAKSVFMERDVEKAATVGGRRTSKLVRRGSSYSKKERERKFRAQLSTVPIKLDDTSAIKVPELPWTKGADSSGPTLKQIMKQSIQSREGESDSSQTQTNVVTNEVEVFDPSLGLNSFYESAVTSINDNPKSSEVDIDNLNRGGSVDDDGANLCSLPHSKEVPFEQDELGVDAELPKPLPPIGARVARPARPKKKPPTKAALNNPAARLSYVETATSLEATANKQNTPSAIHVEGLNPAQRRSILTEAAVKGLEAKENFGSIKLTKMETNKVKHENRSLNPYNNAPMLMMVKGRYHVQVRLVAPTVRSMNESDCFVVVTKTDVMVWKGHVSNIVEQNKAMELGKLICDRKQLGCEADTFEVIESGKNLCDEKALKKKFLRILASANDNQFEEESSMMSVCEDVEAEDVWYEDCITATNKVYEVDTTNNNAALFLLLDSSCTSLSHSLLQSDKSLVFDFGSEVYVWFGKDATVRDRSIAPLLLTQLVDKGYDYRRQDGTQDKSVEYVLCPLYPLDDDTPLYSEKRPAWVICGKVNENMETLLFSNKFADWPETGFMKEVRTAKNFTDEKFQKIELNPIRDYDFRELMKAQDPLENGLVVEAVNVGRGDYWKDPIELRAHKVITTGVKCWPVSGSELRSPLDETVDHVGLFRDDEIYIVRWSFYTELTGIRTLKGVKQRENMTKQPPKDEKVAYFFWQGKRASKLDLGTSALKVVDLDLEGGKQMRVAESEEPAAFLRLFKGHMLVQSSAVLERNPTLRLFYVQGPCDEERHLIEVEHIKDYLLRPYLCYVALKINWQERNCCYVIRGPLCNSADAEFAKRESSNFLDNRAGRKLIVSSTESTIVEEMSWSDLKSAPKELCRLLPQISKDEFFETQSNYRKRLILLTSVTRKAGSFAFQEVNTPFHESGYHCSLPFIQTQLYHQIQPAFLLYDCGNYLFLWQGPASANHPTDSQGAVDWLEQRRSVNSSPEHSEPQGRISPESPVAGSVNRRFIAERKRALETAKNYAQEKRIESSRCLYVEAGQEPLSFRLLFPWWNAEQTGADMAGDGTVSSGMVTIEEKMVQLASVCYSLEVLRKRPLPSDVDPLRIEDCVKEEDFEGLFKMPRDKFESLPQWRKTEMKKKANLF